jgi:hypothetical protein
MNAVIMRVSSYTHLRITVHNSLALSGKTGESESPGPGLAAVISKRSRSRLERP